MLNQKNDHRLTSGFIINYFNLLGAEDEILDIILPIPANIKYKLFLRESSLYQS
jgi:hypothetical protein